MKNRAAVAQRTASRLSNAEHVYQLTPNYWTVTEARKTPAETWSLTSADELFPSDSGRTDNR